MKESCENCKTRGNCCKGFRIRRDEIPWAFTSKDNKTRVLSRIKKLNLPFVPTEKRGYFWWFKCKKLDQEGKCAIYSNRPQICKDYKIGEDSLCYFYKKV